VLGAGADNGIGIAGIAPGALLLPVRTSDNILHQADPAGRNHRERPGHAGLRPGEALALRWRAIGERTIRIDRAMPCGEEKETKTGRSRSVRLLAPLHEDLASWRLVSGRDDSRGLLFPRPDGRPWGEDDWHNWRNRVFRPAASAVA